MWLIVVLTIAAIAGVGVSLLLRPIAALEDGDVVVGTGPVEVEVLRGETASAVVARLVDDGVLVASAAWPAWLRIARPGGCLQAGRHTVAGDASADELFDALCEVAYAPGVRLTVPEGTSLYQLADLVAASGLDSRDAVLDASFDAEFAAELGIDARTLEGYLAPDTYEFPADADAHEILAVLASEGATVRGAALGSDEGSGHMTARYSMHEVLTVASIVEEEARVAEERPRIARVIYNRLARGMPIQCDPTCVYRPDAYDQVPTRALCRDPESTHSTYVLRGLPPTPISNPGRASIEAALAPVDDPDVLYFVAMRDGTGRHAFADTLAEHNRNVDRYLR